MWVVCVVGVVVFVVMVEKECVLGGCVCFGCFE